MSNYEHEEGLEMRTKRFGLRVVRLFQTLQNKPHAQMIANNLLRSATSVAENYWAACRARSSAEFTSKAGVALEEAGESLFWLEMLEKSEIVKAELLISLKQEQLN